MIMILLLLLIYLLGEGFQLAERDMAIRGIGNIFGEKQSGHLDNIGSDYFVKLLTEQLQLIEEAKIPNIRYSDVSLSIPYSEISVPFDFLSSDTERDDFRCDLDDAVAHNRLKEFLRFQNSVHSKFPPQVTNESEIKMEMKNEK